MLNPEKPLPVLRVRPCDLAPRALLVGDPERASRAASLLDNPREIGNNREYRTFSGEYRGKQIVVCSHGVGGAGASVCFAELFESGVKIAIRSGTCGALVEIINDGELIIATGAIREDGTSEKLIPLAYPAISSWKVIQALQIAAKSHDEIHLHTGLVLTQSFHYPGLLPTTTSLWMQAGAVCVEMELATLLVMAGLHGVQAGGILTSDGNLARRKEPHLDPHTYDPHREVVQAGIQTNLSIALEALYRL